MKHLFYISLLCSSATQFAMLTRLPKLVAPTLQATRCLSSQAGETAKSCEEQVKEALALDSSYLKHLKTEAQHVRENPDKKWMATTDLYSSMTGEQRSLLSKAFAAGICTHREALYKRFVLPDLVRFDTFFYSIYVPRMAGVPVNFRRASDRLLDVVCSKTMWSMLLDKTRETLVGASAERYEWFGAHEKRIEQETVRALCAARFPSVVDPWLPDYPHNIIANTADNIAHFDKYLLDEARRLDDSFPAYCYLINKFLCTKPAEADRRLKQLTDEVKEAPRLWHLLTGDKE